MNDVKLGSHTAHSGIPHLCSRAALTTHKSYRSQVYITVKKQAVDLAPTNHLSCSPGSSKWWPTSFWHGLKPLSTQGFQPQNMNLVANKMYNCMFLLKKGGTYSCIVVYVTLDSIHALYWNFWVHKSCNSTVGGGKDQGPTAQVTHLRNQPFLFCSVHLMLFLAPFTCTSTSLPNCHMDQGWSDIAHQLLYSYLLISHKLWCTIMQSCKLQSGCPKSV